MRFYKYSLPILPTLIIGGYLAWWAYAFQRGWVYFQ